MERRALSSLLITAARPALPLRAGGHCARALLHGPGEQPSTPQVNLVRTRSCFLLNKCNFVVRNKCL